MGVPPPLGIDWISPLPSETKRTPVVRLISIPQGLVSPVAYVETAPAGVIFRTVPEPLLATYTLSLSSVVM